jgi:hypothetical protein
VVLSKSCPASVRRRCDRCEKQRLLKVRLKAADLLADRRLGEVQLIGGLVKTAEAGRRFEAAQGAERWPVFEHR